MSLLYYISYIQFSFIACVFYLLMEKCGKSQPAITNVWGKFTGNCLKIVTKGWLITPSITSSCRIVYNSYNTKSTEINTWHWLHLAKTEHICYNKKTPVHIITASHCSDCSFQVKTFSVGTDWSFMFPSHDEEQLTQLS